MKALPHSYKVQVSGHPEGNVVSSAVHLPSLVVAPPKEFDGPGDQWSPEELFLASISNCLVLSFRAVSKASRLDWQEIECESEGCLEKADGKIKFTKITSKVKLVIAPSENPEKAEKLLNKAEASCLISNSISAETHLTCEISVREQ